MKHYQFHLDVVTPDLYKDRLLYDEIRLLLQDYLDKLSCSADAIGDYFDEVGETDTSFELPLALEEMAQAHPTLFPRVCQLLQERDHTDG